MTSRFEHIQELRSEIPRLLMLVGDTKSASWVWRCVWPTAQLANHGFLADWCPSNDTQQVVAAIEAGRYNMIVTPRAYWQDEQQADNWITYVRKQQHLTWVYEVDDNGWSPEIVQRQSKLYENEWGKGEDQLEHERLGRIAYANRSDGIVVSTEPLAQATRAFTDKPVWCVPNLIDINWFAGRISDAKRIIEPLTIGWSGAVRDQADLSVMAQAWTRVASRYPQVKFIVQGTAPEVLLRAVPHDQLIQMRWVELPDYPRALMNFDIACCAVEDNNEFNRSKSCIKWYETSLAGSATVVSDALYGREVTHDYDGLIARTVDDWETALVRLVESASERKRISENAKETIKTHHTIQDHWYLWIEALAAILQDTKVYA